MHSYRSGFVQNVFGEFLFYESDENANNVGLTKETFDKMLFKPFDSGDFCK